MKKSMLIALVLLCIAQQTNAASVFATRRAERLARYIQLREERRLARLSRMHAQQSSSQSSLAAQTPEEAILAMVNAQRQQVGLTALTINPLLMQAAQAYAEDMQARDFFAHNDPDGHTSLDRIKATGYLTPTCHCSWSYWVGENLAKGQVTAEKAMHDWMNSPEHKENILSEHFTEIGIGRSGIYWVQEFGQMKTFTPR